MPRIGNEIAIDRAADDVWVVLGDLGAVAEWVPGLESARVEGTSRVCRLADGGEIHEEIEGFSDERRTYGYTQPVHPLGFKSSRGTLRVEPAGAGSRVLWTAEVEFVSPEQEAQMLPMLEGGYRLALERLKERVER